MCKEDYKTIEANTIHSFWLGMELGVIREIEEDDEEDFEDEEGGDLIETQYLNGNNEMVKIFNQKCVIFYEKDNVYAFRQCGHQCISEDCYQYKGDNGILKCVTCRT